MKQSEYDLGQVIAVARRRSKRDKDLMKVLEVALKHPDLKWAKHTTSGLTLCGPMGTVGTHFTKSDHRSTLNFVSDLRRAGLYPVNRKA